MLIKNIEHTIIDLTTKNNLKTYYDIGASLTTHTLALFNYLINVGVSIYAFEPNPISYKKLKNLFPTQSVNVYNIGIGNKNEEKVLYSTDSDIFLSSFSEEFLTKKTGLQYFDQTICEIRRLDDTIKTYSLPKPDIIKVDVEDWEDQAIESIPLENKPIILAEYHSYQVRINVEEILRFKYDQNIFFNKGTKKVRYFVYTPNDVEYIF